VETRASGRKLSQAVAGYSGKTLGQKLGLKPGFAVAAINAPPGYRELLRPWPKPLRYCTAQEGPQLIHYFCTDRARLAKDLLSLRKKMRDETMLWISWPKKSAAVKTTVTEDVVRELALPLGLVDNKVCAVDETWSALRLVMRLIHRHDSSKRTG
jgi:hypothetical protein